jgi:iron complex outermembrane recepter protein
VIGAYFEQRRTSQKNIVTRIDSGAIYDGYIFGSPNRLQLSKYRDVSVFGEIGYKITPELEITGGLRQTWFKISGTLDEGVLPLLQSQNEPKSTNPQLNVTYKPSRNQTFFARVAKGFRAPDVEYADSSCNTSKLPFKGVLQPDSLYNYEIGSKSRFADGKVLLNASAYLINWNNIPVFVVPDGCNATTRTNGGQARSYGVEAEMTARITQNLTLDASVTYNNSKLKTVIAGFSGGAPGDKLPGTADMRFNLGLSYEKDLNDTLLGFATTSFTYVGPYSNEFPAGFRRKVNIFNPIPVRIRGLNGDAPIDLTSTNPINLNSGDYALVNMRLGLKAEKWSVSAYVNNIFDGGRNVLLAANASDGLLEYAFIPARPRTFGLDFSANF